MDTDDFERILRTDPRAYREYLGTFPADQLPAHMTPTSSLLIVNCCNIGYPGEHWLALCKSGGTLEVFDSYGMSPNFYNLSGKLPDSSTIRYSTKQLQALQSSVCGYYCLYYCFYKARGYSLDNIISRFSNDYSNNDLYVYKRCIEFILQLFLNVIERCNKKIRKLKYDSSSCPPRSYINGC